jgi:DNA polymerase-1
MLANDPTMKFIFQTGGDIHTETGIWVSGKASLTKEERKQAKAVNFGFIYGMGWKKFQTYARDKYDVIFTDKQAKEARRKFFERYATLLAWHEKQRRIVHRQGFVRTMMGRPRHLPTVWSDNEQVSAEAERQAINSPVQGFASDLNLASVVDIHRKFSKKIVRMNSTVHDSTLMWVKTEHAFEVIPQIQKVMEAPSALKKLGVRMTVPIRVDVKIGPWGKGVERDTRWWRNEQDFLDAVPEEYRKAA